MASPRLHLRRAGGVLLLACTPELAEYAERLGRVADAIAGENPLPPPLRVFQRLYEVAQPEFPPDCAAAEQRADHPPGRRRQRPRPPSRPGRNSTPRDMDARRALQLGLGALTGLEVSDLDRKGERFDPPGIRERIAARYPEAEPLPDRPELDDLLREAGLDVDLGRDDDHVPAAGRVAARHVGFLAAARPPGPARRTGRGARAGRSTPRRPRPASSTSGCGSRSATAPSSS